VLLLVLSIIALKEFHLSNVEIKDKTGVGFIKKNV
jgi:hypothetical protein